MRLKSKDRKQQILTTALEIVEVDKINYAQLTHHIIAEKLKINRTAISYYFKNLKILRKKIIEEAIKQKYLPVLVQALCNDETVRIPERLKTKALRYLNNKVIRDS